MGRVWFGLVGAVVVTRDGDGPRTDPREWVDNRQRVEARYAIGDGVAAVGHVISYCDAPTVTIETDDGQRVSWRADLTVEVLERADDPSKSLRGEVREVDGMSAVCYGKNYWVRFSDTPGSVAGYGIYRDEQMVGTPVIGVVPGTPAAEEYVPDWERELIEQEAASARLGVRVENTPHGPAAATIRLAAEELAAGNFFAAVNLVKRATGWRLELARRYVEDMAEYQAHVSEYGEVKS